MDINTENPLLSRNLQAIGILGMWAPKNSKYVPLYNVYSKCVFIWFVCFTTSQFIEIYYVYDDFKELTSNAGVSLLYAVAISKVYLILSKKQKVKTIVNAIRYTELNILKENNPKIIEILKDYIDQNWRVSKKFWILTFWTILGFFVSPTLESLLTGPQEIKFKNGTETGRFKKPLVFSSWFPFDKYSNGYYALAYGLQTISGTIGASYLAVWDTFIVALMIYAIGQFRILQYTLKHITDKHQNVGLSVKNLELKYVQDLNSLISPVMFLDFMVCSLMLCAIGLEATLEGPTIRLGFTVEYLISMLVQLFMFYWHANEVMLESVKVCTAAWGSRWYDCSNRVKKSVILIMMRAQKPVKLTAGPFYVMSLQTFITILRASYSYLALLRQVYSREPDEM